MGQNGKQDPVKIEKRFSISGREKVVRASYRITYHGEKRKTNFGIEFNINLLAGNAQDRYYEVPGHSLEDRKLASVGALRGVTEVHLIDEWNKMNTVLRTDQSCDLWRFPIETVSLSESGFEKIFQGSCLLLHWPLDLDPGVEFKVNVDLGIEHL
jgi:alpha-amylase